MRDVVIVDSVRTGLAKAFRGSFNQTRSDDMLAHCIDSLLDRNEKIAPDEVEDIVVGAASHAGEQDGPELVPERSHRLLEMVDLGVQIL